MGTTTSASVSVIDDDSATWMVSADPEETTEGGSATITVSVANGKTFSDDRSVSLVVTGSATSSDYSLTGTQITLVAGSTSTTASVSAIDDDMVESDETVIVTATDDGQTIGSVTITIEANDSPTWTVSAQPDEIAEGGTSTVTVAVSNNRTFAADQTISLAVEGTAASSDYSLSGTQIILAAGATSITASVSATDDVIAEGAETVTLKATHDGQTLGSATVTISASDIPLSTDATLSSLALSGADFGTFSSAVVDYSTSVEYAVSATTVTAEASDDGASVSIADADGSTLGTSRTISLSLGNNEITVTVTAEDGTTGVYAVIVTRAEPDTVWGERLPDRDIEVGSGAQPSGLWSDGTTMWIITDPAAGRISVYSLADGAEQAERGFTLAGGAAFASALWSDGTTLWVADLTAGRVRAYSLSDGTRRAGQDLDTGTLYSAGNGLPSGLWSDGATMWVADYGAMRVFAYDLTTSARQAPREFDLYKRSGESYNPYGIWSNGDTLLVSNWIGGEVVVHYLSDGQRRPELDISTLPSRTSLVTGIWSDGQVLWVSDNDNVGVAIYAYAVPGLGSTQ